jgi:hypothetical protein
MDEATSNTNGVTIMLFRKNPEKMTVEEQPAYLVRKLGSRFMDPMFKAEFTHFNIAGCWQERLASVAPASGTWSNCTTS